MIEKEEQIYFSARTIPEFLKISNELRATGLIYEYVKARWNYYTDMTKVNRVKSNLAQMSYLRLDKKIQPIALKLATPENLKNLSSEEFRAFEPFTKPGLAVLSEEEQKEYTDLRGDMGSIYSKMKIDGLDLEPGIETIIRSSKNRTEVDYFWKKWHHEVGKQIKPMYRQYLFIAHNRFTK